MFAHTLYSALSKIYVNVRQTDSDDGSRGLVSAGGSRFAGMDDGGPQNLLRAGHPVFILPVAGAGVETYLQSDCRATDFEDAFTPEIISRLVV